MHTYHNSVSWPFWNIAPQEELDLLVDIPALLCLDEGSEYLHLGLDLETVLACGLDLMLV